MLFRVLPPPEVEKQTLTVRGKTYSGKPGTPVDCPVADALALGANGWHVIGQVGPSEERPGKQSERLVLVGGEKFVDTTLGALLIYDRQCWRNAVTGAAV